MALRVAIWVSCQGSKKAAYKAHEILDVALHVCFFPQHCHLVPNLSNLFEPFVHVQETLSMSHRIGGSKCDKQPYPNIDGGECEHVVTILAPPALEVTTHFRAGPADWSRHAIVTPTCGIAPQTSVVVPTKMDVGCILARTPVAVTQRQSCEGGVRLTVGTLNATESMRTVRATSPDRRQWPMVTGDGSGWADGWG